MNNLINQEQLSQLLLHNWANILDKNRLIRTVLEDAQKVDLQTSQEPAPIKNLSISVTKFSVINNAQFEIWVEFSIPKNYGTIVGSHVYFTELNGNFQLQNTYGMIFPIK